MLQTSTIVTKQKVNDKILVLVQAHNYIILLNDSKMVN